MPQGGSGPLRTVHLTCNKWPGGLVNCAVLSQGDAAALDGDESVRVGVVRLAAHHRHHGLPSLLLYSSRA